MERVAQGEMDDEGRSQVVGFRPGLVHTATGLPPTGLLLVTHQPLSHEPQLSPLGLQSPTRRTPMTVLATGVIEGLGMASDVWRGLPGCGS